MRGELQECFWGAVQYTELLCKTWAENCKCFEPLATTQVTCSIINSVAVDHADCVERLLDDTHHAIRCTTQKCTAPARPTCRDMPRFTNNTLLWGAHGPIVAVQQATSQPSITLSACAQASALPCLATIGHDQR